MIWRCLRASHFHLNWKGWPEQKWQILPVTLHVALQDRGGGGFPLLAREQSWWSGPWWNRRCPYIFCVTSRSGPLRPELFTVPYSQLACPPARGLKGSRAALGTAGPAPGAPQMASKLEDGAEFQGCKLCVVLAAAGQSSSKSWDCPQCLQWGTRQ